MNSVEKLCKILHERSAGFSGNFYVPQRWNCAGFPDYTVSEKRPGEISVNPYDFFSWNIEKSILGAAPVRDEAAGGQEPPLTQNILYAMLPRFFSAWPHGENGEIKSGTFLKCLALLPLVKKFRTDILYLLPVFKHSGRYKKGSLGSPYSIRDFYSLDEGLHDPLLGDTDVEFEFKAFVEACHMLGIRVMLDFAFRTAARDNELVYSHPDWFYWIKAEKEKDFRPPVIETSQKDIRLDGNTLKNLYQTARATGYLEYFSPSPDQIDPEKWKKISAAHERGEDAFAEIVNQFGVTTAPGFSDIINDRQPPWTDVTYLRFYFDSCAPAQAFLEPGQPPYIMQDGASLNVYRGKAPNRELWDYIANVIPFYEQKFGIDGARIDMAHALPAELCGRIIANSRRVNPKFILWSEELNPAKSGQASRSGFDFISGFTYMDYKNFQKDSFNRNLLKNSLLPSAVPVTAALETPDTPRAALLYPDRRFLKMLTVLNCFMPNSLPILHNGQELLEIQPVNLGLDNSERGKYVLPKTDPMYAKLALFDPCCLHWLQDCGGIDTVLCDALSLRKRFSRLIGDPSKFILQPSLLGSRKFTLLCYKDWEECLFVLANRSVKKQSPVLGKILPAEAARGNPEAEILYHPGGLCSHRCRTDEPFPLSPGETVIGRIDCLGNPSNLKNKEEHGNGSN